MGLLHTDHRPTINKELEHVILERFSLRIINEHDLKHGKKYPPETTKPKPYMATRYLETQHHNKQGKTSGDGRSIWNVLEEEYVFNWLSWDGDNMLASGAILDYGSIRQFAAKHDKYRFRDMDRYSASLTEQRYWARLIVQTFAQAMAFICSEEKQNLRAFKDAACLSVFNSTFETESNYRVLWRMGFTPEQIDQLIRSAQKEIKEFHRSLTYFEDLKVSKGIEKLPDGLTHKPVFLIRNLLRQLPAYYVAQTLNRLDDESAYMPDDIFLRVMAASYVGKRDRRLTRSRSAQVRNFQQCYLRLIAALDA